MKRVITGLICAAASVAAVTGIANAHRMWLLPSTFILSGDAQWVTFDGAISNDLFFPNHVALPLQDVHVTAPDGSEVEIANGATGQFRSTFDVHLDQQGTYRVAETGALYFASWIEDGEPQRRRGSLAELQADGVTAIEGVTLMHSARRVETFVTLGAPSTGAFALSGTGIELMPVTHPNDVYVGEEARFRAFLDGEPAAGLVVEIVLGNDRYRDSDDALHLETSQGGEFAFTPDRSGRYWVSIGRSRGGDGPPTPDSDGIIRLASYAATIEALEL